MATNQTENYQLNQWEPTDKVLRTDFNADNLKIDTALKALAQTVAETAAGAGNCEMEVITYTGTGAYGTENPTQISFTQKPDIYIVAGDLALLVGCSSVSALPLLICKDAAYSESFVNTPTGAVWDGSQLSLTNGVHTRYQMNTKNAVYWVLGLRKRG